MFSKQEQRMWIKIQCARSRTAEQCHRRLQEACGAAVLPFRTVPSATVPLKMLCRLPSALFAP
ncbi:hypothetical protein C0J52_03331 [Blattella germanica]|nr:hypothetical protein C0J52_03331 [Blattella germanica]